MPTQDGIWRKQCAKFLEQLATENFAADGEFLPLIIVEQDSLLPKLFFQDLIFDSQMGDDILLLTVNPSDEDEEVELERLKDETHKRLFMGEVFQQLFTVPDIAAMELYEPRSPGNLLLELFTYHGCTGSRDRHSGRV